MSSTKSEKTDSQSCILYDSSSMHSGKKQNHQDSKKITGCPGFAEEND